MPEILTNTEAWLAEILAEERRQTALLNRLVALLCAQAPSQPGTVELREPARPAKAKGK